MPDAPRIRRLTLELEGDLPSVRVTHDLEVDAVYVEFSDGPCARTVAESEGVIVDLDAQGRLIGFEVLGPSRAEAVRAVADKYASPGDRATFDRIELALALV